MSRLKLNVKQSVWILLSIIIYTPLFSQDNTPPEITVPAVSLSVPCSSNNILGNLTNWYNDNGGAEATDNSGTVSFIAEPSLTNAISIFEASSDSLCGLTKSVQVTFIAVDPSGNESLPSVANFSTFDNVNPVITTPAQNVTINCNSTIRDSLISWIQAHGHAEASDACSDTIIWTTFVSNLPPFGSFPIDEGPYPNLPSDKCDLSVNLTFFAEDECGNRTTSSGTFRIMDTDGPVFDTLPPDITVSCADLPSATTLIAIDSCYGEVFVNFQEESNQNLDTIGCDFYNYEILRTWTAEDLCGNSTTHTQIISIRDLEPPTIEITNPLVINCKDILADNVMNNIDTIYDDCSDSLLISFTDNGSISGCEYSLLRIYSVKDLCENETQVVQTLLVRDTIPPTITVPAKDSVYDCGVDVNFNQIFRDWVEANGGSESIDECSSIAIFAAVPGSYDVNDPFSFPGQEPDTFDMNVCPSGLNGFLRYETVDFLHIDECQNISVTSATFGIIDTNPPIVTTCPSDVTVTLDQDKCSAEVGEVFPAANDNCTATTSPIIQTDIVSVTSSDPGNPEVIVDTVKISIGPFNTNTFSPLSPPIFEVRMLNLDADDNSEYFTIFNESGLNIGQTPPTPMQCGDTTFTIANQSFEDLVMWLEDGFIEFTFVPNNPANSGVLGINAVCTGARLEVDAIIDINPINTLNVSYQINNDNPVVSAIGDSIFFDVSVGENLITYIFEDCANNRSECFQTILANDVFPPTIDCGDTLDFNLDTTACTLQVGFPLDISVSENCQFAEAYRKTFPVSEEAQLMIFDYDSTNMVHLATNRLFSFTGVERMVYGNEAFLYLEINGDINDPGETITLRGEDGVTLGRTQVVQKNGCQQTILTVSIPRTAFNLWAADGKIDILAIAPTGSIEGGGINPCTPISPEMTVDGISSIKGTLVYYDAQIKYTVNGDTTVYDIDNTQDSIFLDLVNGENQINFEVEDLGGNITSCTKIVNVRDSIAPNALCRDGIVEIHPSGLISSTVHPDSIDNQSFDNCEITNYSINSDTLTCEDVGRSIMATLVVEDGNGNIDSCEAMVQVISYQLSPFFTAGICSGDTLRLFANVPPSPPGGSYTFEWTKDGTVISNDENPIIPNASSSLNGLYALTVNGFAGCISQGEIEVNIMPLIKPDIQSAEPSICLGEEVVLSCTEFSGQVIYSWYQGIHPAGVLLGTSSVAEFTVNPTMTNNTYYVIANNTECETPPSDQITIDVFTKPIPEVEESFITVCVGDTIILRSTNTNPEYNYSWIGPDGFSSTQKETNPIIAASSKEGEYKLVVSIGACLSDTAIVTIATLGRPETPEINGESIYCKGSTFSLAVNNVTNGTTYMWYQDGILFRTTQDNSLDIPNAQVDLTGDWTVVVIRDGCASLPSSVQSVTVDDLINVGATNSGPLCAGDTLILDATFVPNATYQWNGPGFSANGQTVMAPAIAGDYTVTITTPTNCSNVASTEVIVNTPPEITALSSDNPDCIDENTVISFSPTIFPNGTYEYLWTGPNNYQSNLLNPTLSDLELIDTGLYTLIVISEGCESEPKTIDISFGFKPETPQVNGLTEICLGDSLVVNTDFVQGVSYNWITPTGQVKTDFDSLVIPSTMLVNQGNYRLVNQNGNCFSDTSNVLNITIKSIPDQPEILGETDVCYGDSIILYSNINDADGYEWTLPNNSTIQNDSIIIDFATANQEGSYQLVYSKNGCQSFVSDMFIVNVRDSIITPMFLDESLSICSDLTQAVEICMSPDAITPGTSYSLVNSENNEIIAETNGICFTISDPSNFNDGSNLLTIIGENNGCQSRTSEGIIILFQAPPNIKAQAFEDVLVSCSSDELVNLESFNGPPEVDVLWTALTPGITISNPTERSALVSDLFTGENLVKLSYSKDGCNDFTNDTVRIFLEPAPILEDDEFVIPFNTSTPLDIFDNDIIPENLDFNIMENGIKGMFVNNGTSINFTPDEGLVGTYTFEYEVCVLGCPDLCETATVRLNIGLDQDCMIPSIITPNEDGINDHLIIPCLDSGNFPKNKIFVFNEWGDQVFSASPYDNLWDGSYGGEPLPVGTYFIVFEPGEGESPIRGFLMLQR